MAIRTLLDEIDADVIDVYNSTFEYANTTTVPNRGDTQLSFERGVAKKGKILKTCVLYVDIRDSIGLTVKHQNLTMGKVYTAFTKGVLKAAKYHNGHIRNIIGDRVMIVFSVENCFTNAVDCALSINHLSSKIINKRFPNVEFKCGIGIDYGDMRVIKVGIPRRGAEGTENRSLVWSGYPANYASRLTDVANKQIKKTSYVVVYEPYNFGSPILGNMFGFGTTVPSMPPSNQTIIQTPEEFAETIYDNKNGTMGILGGNLVSVTRKKTIFSYSPILMTDVVYKGFKAANPNRKCITHNYWKIQSEPIKDIASSIYGGDVLWSV